MSRRSAEVGRTRPDILFLDVQMPEVDGFEVLERLDPQRMPVVVFVTAYDRYAVRAFEVHAVDYLLKPVDADRFREALRHARARVADRIGDAGDAGVTALMQERAAIASRLLVPARGRTLVVEVATIDWIEATDYYASMDPGQAQRPEAVAAAGQRETGDLSRPAARERDGQGQRILDRELVLLDRDEGRVPVAGSEGSSGPRRP